MPTTWIDYFTEFSFNLSKSFKFDEGQTTDTNWKFEEAYVYGLDGTLIAHGNVDSWRDFDNSDMMQVTIDGTTYLTFSSNIILVHHKNN